MAFHVSVQDLKDYKEMLIPAGKYQVEVVSAKDKQAQSGRDMMNLRLKILDTIPSGEPIDTDNFLDPIDQSVFKMLMAPMEGDKSNTVNMFNSNIAGYLRYFDVEAADPEKLQAEDFVGCVGGVNIKHVRFDKDDPESDLKVEVDKACAVS